MLGDAVAEDEHFVESGLGGGLRDETDKEKEGETDHE